MSHVSVSEELLKQVAELLASLGDHVGNVDPRTGVDRTEVLLGVRRALEGAGEPELPLVGVGRSGDPLEGLKAAFDAVSAAYCAVAETGPHPRDYPDEASCERASAQHLSRLSRLTSVQREIRLLSEGVADGGRRPP